MVNGIQSQVPSHPDVQWAYRVRIVHRSISMSLKLLIPSILARLSSSICTEYAPTMIHLQANNICTVQGSFYANDAEDLSSNRKFCGWVMVLGQDRRHSLSLAQTLTVIQTINWIPPVSSESNGEDVSLYLCNGTQHHLTRWQIYLVTWNQWSLLGNDARYVL